MITDIPRFKWLHSRGYQILMKGSVLFSETFATTPNFAVLPCRRRLIVSFAHPPLRQFSCKPAHFVVISVLQISFSVFILKAFLRMSYPVNVPCYSTLSHIFVHLQLLHTKKNTSTVQSCCRKHFMKLCKFCKEFQDVYPLVLTFSLSKQCQEVITAIGNEEITSCS